MPDFGVRAGTVIQTQIVPWKLCLPFSPPSSALVMASSSLGSPVHDSSGPRLMHMVKTGLGTGVACSPGSDELRSSLYMPPMMSLATNLFRLPTVDKTFSFSPPPRRRRPDRWPSKPGDTASQTPPLLCHVHVLNLRPAHTLHVLHLWSTFKAHHNEFLRTLSF